MTQRKESVETKKKKKQTRAVAVRLQRKKQKTNGYWSELPRDLLRSIMERLHWTQRIRARTVCKNWKIQIHAIPRQPLDTFPWIMSYAYRAKYNTRFRNTSKLANPSLQEIHLAKKDFPGGKVCASRCGCVLFSRVVDRGDSETERTLFFLYSPFTNKVVELPPLQRRFQKATFSKNLNSLDCVVFVPCFGRNRLWISICRLRNKYWRTLEFEGDYFTLLDVTYCNGYFYCAFKKFGGDRRVTLGIFSVALGEWEECTIVSGVGRMLQVFNPRVYLIACNEELLLVTSRFKYWEWDLWRFTLSENRWDKGESLGNRTVFLGCTSFAKEAVGELSKFADKFFWFDYQKKVVCSTGFGNAIREWRTELYSWIPKDGLERVWIELPPPPLDAIIN